MTTYLPPPLEGTPGGEISEDSYGIKSNGEVFNIRDTWDGTLPNPRWVAFVDNSNKRGIYLWHQCNNSFADSYWLMEQSMTVFGFGRRELDKYINVTPTKFVIGLINNCSHEKVDRIIKGMKYTTESELI